jgi:hypothetical protein
LTTCGGQNLWAKEKRSGTHADASIAKTPRTLLDCTIKTLSKSAGVLIELSKTCSKFGTKCTLLEQSGESMRKNLKPILICVFAALLLVLFSMFHSYVYNVPFEMALYLTGTTIIVAMWQLLMNPIVLVAIAAYGFWLLARDQFPSILSAITELKFGDISAKLDASKFFAAKGIEISSRPNPNRQSPDKKY